MSALGERLRTRASVITLPLFKAMGMSHSNFDRRFRCVDVLQGEMSCSQLQAFSHIQA
jgi:hypothetical protein